MLKINLKKIMGLYVLIIVISIVLIICLMNIKDNIIINTYVIITFIINGIIILIGCLEDKRAYSLNKIYWYFSFFFIFLAPLFQYLSGYKMWGVSFEDSDYEKGNCLIIIWNIIYFITYNIKFKSSLKKEKKKNTNEIKYQRKFLYIGVIASSISILLGLVLIGKAGLFVRNNNFVSTFEYGFINTIINNFIRTIPVFFLTYALYYYKINKKGMIVFLVYFFICTLILNYPISSTRYWIGAVYLGILIIFAEKKLNNKKFDLIIIATFAILFPVFQLFKWYDISDIFIGKATKDLINCYNNEDFDAYSIFLRTLIYVKNYGITYGRQLMSTLLFFIPRIIWPNKSIPSGELIAIAQGQKFTNISSPIIAEAYINFGSTGLILYPIILGIVFKVLDKNYWNRSNNNNYISYVYPYLLGLMIFILRGAFHPAIVYTVSFYLFLAIVKIIHMCYCKIIPNN